MITKSIRNLSHIICQDCVSAFLVIVAHSMSEITEVTLTKSEQGFVCLFLFFKNNLLLSVIVR